jgi:uncharacterized caspase-like protein
MQMHASTKTLLLTILVLVSAFAPRPAFAVERRLALVIGNGAYAEVASLGNALNDARDVAARLKALKFEVTLLTDANFARMTAELNSFRGKLTREDIGLIYYAGHGIAVSNESFLMPVDTPAELTIADDEAPEDALNEKMVSMAKLVNPLENAKLGLVFLDACRSVPTRTGLGLNIVATNASATRRRSIKVSRGVGSVEVPRSSMGGIFRVYATELGRESDDGSGRNSPFTAALLKHISTPNLPLSELMIRVRKDVLKTTNNEQRPWEEGALNESFYFARTAAASPASSGSTSPSRPRSPGSYSSPGGRASTPPSLGAGVGAGL